MLKIIMRAKILQEQQTIADTLKRMEDEAEKRNPECIEVLAYVKNHLKENNIIIE